MTAVRASLAGFPCAGELLVLGLHARIETGRDEGGHGGGLADIGSTAADERATGPAAGLSRHRRKACETCGLPWLGAELGHFDEQGEGGDGREAWNAGKIASRWASMAPMRRQRRRIQAVALRQLADRLGEAVA